MHGSAFLLTTAATTLAIGAATTRSAHADLRSFTHTYEYATMPARRTALELWHTQTRGLSTASNPSFYQGILEIEHGLTDHWDIAFYQVFEQAVLSETEAESLHLSEVKLETRYRLAERGELPVDTLFYFEAAKQFGASLYEVEGKVIGARDFGDVTLAVNAIAELELGDAAPETELELGFAVGATYQVSPKLRIGVETWAEIEEFEEVYLDAGPAISFAPAANFWATITLGFALTEREEDLSADHGFFSARAIVGIEL